MSKFLETERTDSWWVGPLLTIFGLGSFGLYSMWAAFQNEHYEFGPYLSPFYAPLIQLSWFPFSPAFLILWAPLGFRTTCYYYRKAYYRSFFADPPGCAVGEPWGKGYRGEAAIPFIFQNIHRMFMYVAVIFIFILWYDAIKGFCWDVGGEKKFGMGLGSLILVINATFLMFYTFGCHSLRHVVGGKVDRFSATSKGKFQFKIWSKVSVLNHHHQLWAWCSLFSVGFTDFYIRMCSMGIFKDIRFF
jgi:hypothetical protein